MMKKVIKLAYMIVLILNSPIFLYPFKTIFKFAIIKHIKSQFLEDEIYRKRIQELKERGIQKKYVFLNVKK